MKNRIHKAPKIPELTRSGYRAFFENFSDDWILEKDYPMSENELRIIDFVRKELGGDAQIFAVRRVEKPDGVKMPDLIINGQKVEIKTVSSKASVQDQTRKALKQMTTGVIYELKPREGVSENFLQEEIKKQTKNTAIKSIFSIKEKSAAGSYPGIDNALIDGFAASYARHDSSISNLILPQNIEKVNKLNEESPLSTLNANEIGMKINEPRKKNSAVESQLKQDGEIILEKPQKLHKPAQKSPEYWQKRSLQRTVAAERQALPYLRRLREEYTRSSNRSIDNVRRIYENYFGKAGFDRQKLREIVPNGEFSKFLREARKLGVELPDNYAFRVSREEFTQAQLWLEMKKLGVFENQISNELYAKIIESSMKRTFGDYGVTFVGVNTRTMNRILNAKFHGKNFSTRIWSRTDRLAEELPAKLALAIAKGQSWEKTSREIRERFGVSQSSAERLIRTETNYFENLAEMEVYAELGVKEFEFLAELDGRTSEICRHHHGKKYKVEKAKAGENIPPLHPNCRSTIVAIIPELERKIEENNAKDDRFFERNYSPREFNNETSKRGIIDFSKLPTSHSDYMYSHEQDFYERLIKKYGDVQRIPKNENSASNDFLIDELEWELKSILADKLNEFTIRNEIFRATDKGKRNIFIDNYKENHNTNKIVEAAKKHISIDKNNKAIDNLVVVSGDSFIKIK